MPKATYFNLPEDKRELLFSLAADEFAENDYENASISRIVAKAGIAKGSFYQYFADKLDLYQFLLDEGIRLKMEFLETHPPPDSTMNVFAYLRWLFKVGLDYQFIHPKLAKVAQRALYGKSPIQPQLNERIRTQSLAYLGNLVRTGIANGQLSPDMDADAAAFVLYAVSKELGDYLMHRLGIDITTDSLLEAARRDGSEAQSIFDHIMDFLEFGMVINKHKGDTAS